MEQARQNSLGLIRTFIREMNEGGKLAQNIMLDHDLRSKTICRLSDVANILANDENELSCEIQKLVINLKFIEAVGKLLVNDGSEL